MGFAAMLAGSYIFSFFQQLSSFVRAGHLLFGFLFLTSSSNYFWAVVPGWTNFDSSIAASPERCRQPV
jgi:hypothetical protein